MAWKLHALMSWTELNLTLKNANLTELSHLHQMLVEMDAPESYLRRCEQRIGRLTKEMYANRRRCGDTTNQADA